MAASKLSQNGIDSRDGSATIENEMQDGKLSDDAQMRMMLAEERISTMMALSQMGGGYGRYPLHSYGQLWPGTPNHFNTFCPYPAHLMVPPYGQITNEPLDLRIPQKRRSSVDKTGVPPKKRCSSGGEIDPELHKLRRNEILESFRNNVTRDTTVGAKRVKRRSSSTSRRSRDSPAVPLSMVPQKSALDVYNNNGNECETDRNCANCDENRKSTILSNGFASRDQPATPEGLMKDEDVAAMLFRPIPSEHSLAQDEGNAAETVLAPSSHIQSPHTPASDTPAQHYIDSDIPVCDAPVPETNSPDSDISASVVLGSDSRGSISPVPAKEQLTAETNDSESEDSAHNMSELHFESLDQPDEDGVDELRSENLAFKQMLANLSGEVEKLKKMMKVKKQSQ